MLYWQIYNNKATAISVKMPLIQEACYLPTWVSRSIPFNLAEAMGTGQPATRIYHDR